jgi:hypothetical protein
MMMMMMRMRMMMLQGDLAGWLAARWKAPAGLDEGLLSFSRPHSRLYGESL